MKSVNLSEIAKKEEKELIKLRNVLHEHPEVAWEENKSLKTIRDFVTATNPCEGRQVKVFDNFKGGLVVDLVMAGEECKGYKTRLFRADIDALPVNECETNNPRSKIPNVMHACGHDIHSAVLAVAFRVLSTNSKLKPQVNIRFVWQRAEEFPQKSGGEMLVKEENLLDGVFEVFGLHVWATQEVGVFGSKDGPFFGNPAYLELTVEAKGGHVATPHVGKNALTIAMDLRSVIENSVAYTKNSTSILSMVPVTCHAGDAHNIMSTKAEMVYSFRNLMTTEERDKVFRAIKSNVEKVGTQLGASKVEIVLRKCYPTTINADGYYEKTKKMLEEEGIKVKKVKALLVGEDFAYYLNKRPGIIFFIGGKTESTGPHHSPTFNPDPKIMWKALLYWMCLAVKK